jgi:hypothetical protein
LQRIDDGDNECCCEHDDENCCEVVEEWCPHCVAGVALKAEGRTQEAAPIKKELCLICHRMHYPGNACEEAAEAEPSASEIKSLRNKVERLTQWKRTVENAFTAGML